MNMYRNEWLVLICETMVKIEKKRKKTQTKITKP